MLEASDEERLYDIVVVRSGELIRLQTVIHIAVRR